MTLLLGAVGALAHGDTQPPAIDLRTHDFADRPIASLAGRWSIYWNRLVDPAEIARADVPAPDGDFVMPATWNDWAFQGQPVGRFGHATFAVRVLLPPEMAEIGLRVPNASTAYRLWGNGQLIAHSGVPGRSRVETTPRYRVVSPRVAVPAGELLLVLHVANYHHRRGGMWKPIELGPVAAVSSKDTLETIYDLLLIGSFAAMTLYNLMLYALRRGTTRAPLFLALLFAVLVFRIPMMGQMIVTQVFPTFPWRTQLRIEYLTAHLALLTFTWTLREIYPISISRRFTLAVTAFVALNVAVLLVGSILLYSLIVRYYVYAMIALLFYETLRLCIALWNGRRNAWYGIGAATITLFITLGETIHYQELILSRDFAPFGFLITLFAGDSINQTTTYMLSAGINMALLFVSANLLAVRGSHALSAAATAPAAVPDRTAGPRLPQRSPNEPFAAEDRLRQFRERYGITEREADVIRLMAHGRSNREIAGELYLSEATVKTHVHRVLAKTGFSNRTEVGRAYFNGFGDDGERV